MIMYFWVGMILFSVVSAAVQGGMGELTSAIMQSAGDAVSLCIRLTGTICLWSGLMNIAERSGLTSAVCRLISPLLRLVFPQNGPERRDGSSNINEFDRQYARPRQRRHPARA